MASRPSPLHGVRLGGRPDVDAGYRCTARRRGDRQQRRVPVECCRGRHRTRRGQVPAASRTAMVGSSPTSVDGSVWTITRLAGAAPVDGRRSDGYRRGTGARIGGWRRGPIGGTPAVAVRRWRCLATRDRPAVDTPEATQYRGADLAGSGVRPIDRRRLGGWRRRIPTLRRFAYTSL